MEILSSGLFESDDQFMQLARRYGQVVIPSEDEELEVTHWWVIKDDGAEMLYVGTPDTFTTYIKETNCGIQ